MYNLYQINIFVPHYDYEGNLINMNGNNDKITKLNKVLNKNE